MLSPFIGEEARQRYQDRVAAADEWRLGQAARSGRPALLARLWMALGAGLVALRQPSRPSSTDGAAGVEHYNDGDDLSIFIRGYHGYSGYAPFSNLHSSTLSEDSEKIS